MNSDAGESDPSPQGPDPRPTFGDPAAPPRPPEETAPGLLGELVRTIRPHTEADPFAIVLQCLVMIGSMIGRTAHWVVEATRHGLNEFLVLVGDSGKGRKGSALSWARKLLMLADPGWVESCVVNGLSTGPGVIAEVHDPIVHRRPVKDPKSGRIVDYEEITRDHGVSDKRRLFVEPEMAQVFARAGTIANGLSAILRLGFDGERLAIKTKSMPQVATGAHIALIGHSTTEEIRQTLSAIDRANGLGNRCVFWHTQRSASTPVGSAPSDDTLKALQGELTRVVSHAKTVGNMAFDSDADALWRARYADLSAARHGPSGSLLSRAEVHVRRFACLYALVGLSAVVRRADLEAALALWAYSEASVRYIFDRSPPDPLVDEILGYLQSSGSGMTRGALRTRIGNHVSGPRITQALEDLRQRGLAQIASIPGPGRHAEHWSAVTSTPQGPPPTGDALESSPDAPQAPYRPMKVKFDFGPIAPPDTDGGHGDAGGSKPS